MEGTWNIGCVAATSEPPAIPAYWVIVVDESKPPPPELRQFEEFQDMVDFIKMVHKEQKTAWVLPLSGTVLRVTRGLEGSSLRFIVHPDGRHIPLFDIPESVSLQDNGFYTPAGEGYIDPDTVVLGLTEDELSSTGIPPAESYQNFDYDEPSDIDYGPEFESG